MARLLHRTLWCVALAAIGCETSNGTSPRTNTTSPEVAPQAFEIDPACLDDPGKHAWIDADADRDFTRANSAYIIGSELAKSGDHRAAQEAFERSVKTDPMHGLAHLALADTHLYTDNDQKKMLDHLSAAVLLLPNNPRAHVKYAALAVERKAANVAIRHWRCALELKPTLAEAHYALARTYLAEGQHDPAEASIRAALESDEKNTQYHVLLGQVLEAKGNPVEAARAVEKAAVLVERSAVLFRRAADLYDAGERPADADRMREIADRIDPPAEERKLRPLRKARKKRQRSRRKR